MQTYGAATLAVSCFPSITTKTARVETMTISDLYKRLQQPYKDNVTCAEFKALSKDEQGKRKGAAGAYMLGEYTGGTRAAAKHKQSKVEYRSALALDLDDLPVQGRKNSIDILAEVQARLDTLECSYIIHETRKSTAEKPRLRVIIPLDRSCSADMYSALIHAVGGYVLNPKWVDNASSVPAQVMYWPTISSDQEYRTAGDVDAEKPPLDVDKVLDNYYVNAPWTEADKWVPLGEETGSRRKKSTKDRAAKETEQADPFKKGGVIGAFCRMFPIDKCIDAFLSGGEASDQHREIMGTDHYPRCYEPAGGDRFTYQGANTTTTGAAVAYDDFRFLYSNHASDPYSRELLNSFGLIQRHIFGKLDDGTDPDTKERDLPSFKAAIRFAAAAEGVQVESFAFDVAAEDTGAENVDPKTGELIDQTAEAAETGSTDWVKPLWSMLDLSTDMWGHTKPRSTINNFLLIFQHDRNLAGKIRYNMFTQRIEIQGRLPKVDVNEDGKSITAFEGPRETPMLRDADEAALRNYVEHRYGISAKEKLKDGIILSAEYNRFHPARDYFNGLPEWDGVERVPYLLTDYLGVEDTPVIREVMTKHMLATVTRVFHGGVKYDTMLVLTGRQGLGKSTFIRNLAGPEWFTDNVGDLADTDSLQAMQGHFFIEFAELDALRKSEVTQIKQFVTRQNDLYRVPYGKNTEEHPRQCVFWGSTNRPEYLRDQTGNRRFACIDCLGNSKEQPRLSVFTDLPKDRDQIWAEAMAIYRADEELYWHGDGLAYTKETAEALEGIAEEHRDADPRESAIIEYCLKPIPSDWSEWTQRERQEYYNGARTARFGFPAENVELVQREYVCVLGIWAEALGGDVNRMTRSDKELITGTLNREAWLKPMQYRDDRYGKPRGWKIIGRPKDDTE